MRDVWDAAFEGVLLHREGRIEALNAAAARLLGVEPERVVGLPLIHALRDRRLLRLSEAGGEAVLEVRGRRVRARAVPGALFLIEAPEDAEREALERLRHELRTPVAAIRGLLEVLPGLEPQEAAEVLAVLRAESERLARLVEEGVYAPAVPPYALDALRPRIERVLPEAKNLRWAVPGVRLRVDPDALFQILLNLIENAYRHGRPPVRLVGGVKGERFFLEVQDRGPKIDDYEALFAPGARGAQSARARGSGLGLAIVRRIARSFGGDAYGRRVGDANAFGVWLPPELWLRG